MTLRGRFLRGGVAAGDAYADHSFVTGPAHLQAVCIEETVAKTPRIVLDEVCVALATAETNEGGYAHAMYSPYANFLLYDSDGRVFVNYLAAVAEDEDFVPGITDAGLLQHRASVEHGLASSQAVPPVHAKYQWLAAYHNYVAVEFFDSSNATIASISGVAFARFHGESVL